MSATQAGDDGLVTVLDPAIAELLYERFGPPPVAELRRPLAEQIGCGGPDTPEAIALRRSVLVQSLHDSNEHDQGVA